MLTESQLLSHDEPSVRLPIFEGPLDLLLFLIRRNVINIYDIPIAEVTHQYLSILRQMENLDLEVAGEFFVMASTLMYLKSRLLLPKEKRMGDEDKDEDGPDPRWELVQQLLEYRNFKEAAGELESLVENSHGRIPRIVSDKDLEEIERPLKPTDPIAVWNAFNLVLRRLADRIMVGEIEDDLVTVADRMEHLLSVIRTQKSFRFSELFEGSYTLNKLAATFLAILELTRLRRLDIRQDIAFGDILCEEAAPEELGEQDLDSAGAIPVGQES